MSTSTILVTGAAGFIGSHLSQRLLALNWRVVGLDNFNDFYDPALKRRNVEAITDKRFSIVDGDIRDRDTVQDVFARTRPEAVIHLAAMAGVRPSIEQPALYVKVNLDGTNHLLDAAAHHGVRRFVFASSSSVYGNNPKVPFAETDFVDHPISPYAATKKAGELLCHTYWHLYKLPTFCLRFFTVFGPRQRPDLAIGKFLRMVSEGKPIPIFGDGTTSRDYTYIDDIVTGIVAALDKCDRYRVYNLGGDHPVTLTQLVETVQKVVGREAIIDRKPMQPGDVERTWADLARSRSELGYAPKTTLEDGIRKQWEWMQAQANEG
ncbi:MAG: GDP-mannose 4,6-dehydratase [Phycisphaeraceae bacterium]|nr:GDP-mannose 4,6-dehydratase [Phycisphaeraceae bacterium]